HQRLSELVETRWHAHAGGGAGTALAGGGVQYDHAAPQFCRLCHWRGWGNSGDACFFCLGRNGCGYGTYSDSGDKTSRGTAAQARRAVSVRDRHGITQSMSDRFKVSNLLARRLGEHRVALPAVLRRAGLPAGFFQQEKIYVTTAELFALWRAIGEASGDPG